MKREQSGQKEPAVWRVLQEQFGGMADYRSQSVKQDNSELMLAYLESIVDSKLIPERLVKPYYENKAIYAQYLAALGRPLQDRDVQQAAQAMLSGQVICCLDGQVFACELRKKEASPVGEAKVEKTVLGPKDTLTESLDSNLISSSR
ncbi:hypothetical protein DUZ99_16440 [Xylanibacillus composti]|uniref:Uncharacterized protein n=1 Tax=Xylanibacillus composti TaxID=1572762 RepID=A0A8J4H5R5_9BACL|nr:spore germination protein [Xylanibacillus composti]MDT9726570.1 hypothetical protein [Xylanibacillus composti]GIQ68988.1 hypothetical protein XYCOK13_18120 [Xylanibacillus composti]